MAGWDLEATGSKTAGQNDMSSAVLYSLNNQVGHGKAALSTVDQE